MSTSPHFRPGRVRHRMAAAGLANGKELAALVGVPYGGLRNTIRRSNPDPVSLHRAYAVARVLASPDETLKEVVADILIDGDGTPDNPPNQPTQPKGPTRRDDPKRGKNGPKRVQDVAA